MYVEPAKLANMIIELEALEDKLKKQNANLNDILPMMNSAWGDDTVWNEKAKGIVTRVIDGNEKTITLFNNTLASLYEWLENVEREQGAFIQ